MTHTGSLAINPAIRSNWILFLLLTSLAARTSGADWPQYRGPQGDGTSNESMDHLEWPASGPRQLWKVATPTGFSSFAVAGGRAFTLVAVEPPGGSERVETCLALDANTGQTLWSVHLGTSDYEHDGGNSGAPGNRGGDGPRSTPASDGARVYVYDAHLVLSCLDAATGDVVWQHDVVAQYSGRNIKWHNASSPVIDSEHVYICGGGPDQSFLAFDKRTGELVWKSGDDLLTHATARVATINDVRQIVYFAQSGLVAVDAASGRQQWRQKFPFATSSAASPIVAGDLVYCSAGYGVGAGLFQIAASQGQFRSERVWFKANELMNHWSTPVYRDGHLYGIYGFKKYGKAPLQCVELETGRIKWSHRGFGPGNCILVGDHLVILTDDGRLVVADATEEGYIERAQAKVIDGKCWSTPAFSDGRIYVRSTEEGACIDVSRSASTETQ